MQTPLTLPHQPRHLLPPQPQPLHHTRHDKPIQRRQFPRLHDSDTPRLGPLLRRPRTKRGPVPHDADVDQARFAHVFRRVATAVEIQALFPRALPYRLEPVPVRAADPAVLVPDVVEILHLDPPARFQQRDDRVAHVAPPVRHAAYQEPAEDVVEAPRREAFVRLCQLFHIALDISDVPRRGHGPLDVRDGGDVEAVDGGSGGVCGAEMVGDGAGAAADVEEAVRVDERGVDDAVVHEFCEAGGLLFEAGVLEGAGGFFSWNQRSVGAWGRGNGAYSLIWEVVFGVGVVG